MKESLKRKRMTPKKYRLFFTVVFMLLLFPVCHSLAAVDLWVSDGAPEERANGIPMDAVRWHLSANGYYYLFLPSCFNIETARVYYTGAESLLNGSKTLVSGDTADFIVPGGKSAAFKNGSREYKVVSMKSANIAALFINTSSGSVDTIHASKENEETGSLLMKEADGAVVYDGALRQIKIRGNSTAQYNKKPYQIKLETKTALISGVKANRTWVLLANVIDKSLLRNAIALGMARAAGIRYTPETRPVDLYINNAYMGSYLLCEKVEVEDGRIDMKDLEKETEAVNDLPLNEYPPFGTTKYAAGASHGYLLEHDAADITGGYLLMTELYTRFDSEASMIATSRGQPVCINSPKYASLAQTEYVSALVQSAENAIFADDGIDPDTGLYYTKIFDMDSLVLKYLLDEIVVNFDAIKSGSYFIKYPDSVSSLLYCCPAWDYDNCMGVVKDAIVINNRWVKKLSVSRNNYYWFTVLSDHEDFELALKKAYSTVYLPIINGLLGTADPADGMLTIDGYADQIRASAEMNQRRWPIRYESFNSRVQDTGADFEANVEYLREFMSGHARYLSSVWAIDSATP
jgi:hypothetical protein